MFKKIVCSVALLCTVSFANAGIITQSLTVERQPTNFTESVVFDFFDNLNGTRLLESVQVTVLARSTGMAQVENVNATATTITATLSTVIEVVGLAGNRLVGSLPEITRTELLAGFDGTVDYAGESGIEFLNLLTSDTDSILLTDAASLLAYTGVGTTSVNFNATANSIIIGGGNISSFFDTFASGDVTIVYTYSDVATAVSAPAHIALMGLGVLGLAGMRRFKR